METDTAASLRTVVGGRLIEALEDIGLVTIGNTLAGIGYSDGNTILSLTKRQSDTAAHWGELQSIREEVVNYFIYFFSIVIHDKTVDIVFKAKVDAALFSIIAERDENTVHMTYNVTTLHVQRLTSCVEAAEVEQGTHFIEQQLGILTDVFQLCQHIIRQSPLLYFLHHLLQW